MLKRLSKIAQRSVQLNSIALTKRAGLATPIAGMAARAGKAVGVGTPTLGAMGAIGGVGEAVNKAKRVAKDQFSPAKRDLMLGTARPG